MAELTEAFDFAMIMLAIVPFLSIYFMPKMYLRINRHQLLRAIVQGFIFIMIMFFLEFLATEDQDILSRPLSETQFFIFGALVLAGYSYYFSITFCRVLDLQTQIVEKEGVLRQTIDKNLSSAIIGLRAKEFRRNWRTLQNSSPSYIVPGPLYLNYHILIEYSHTESNRSVFITHAQSPRNAQVYRILTFVTGILMVFARAQDNDKPTIRTFIKLEEIDAQLWFSVGAIILLLFSVALVFFAEMTILVMEENYNKAVRGEALSLAIKRPKIPEKPQVDVTDVRRQAQERLERSRKKAEEEKKKQIEKIMGQIPEDEKTSPRVNPEVIRLEALIREIQNIVLSTPPHRIVTVDEVAAKVGGKTTVNEVESIIIGLIRRKEVRGRYNIWNKTYQGGNESERFIEQKLLELSEGETKNLTHLKIGADGAVEFQFLPQYITGKESRLKEDINVSKKSKKPKE